MCPLLSEPLSYLPPHPISAFKATRYFVTAAQGNTSITKNVCVDCGQGPRRMELWALTLTEVRKEKKVVQERLKGRSQGGRRMTGSN